MKETAYSKREKKEKGIEKRNYEEDTKRNDTFPHFRQNGRRGTGVSSQNSYDVLSRRGGGGMAATLVEGTNYSGRV